MAELTIGHSPDPDDVFMWWPLTGMIDPADASRVIRPPVLDGGGVTFRAVPRDISELNERAASVGDLDITAISFFAWTRVADRYALCACGSSFGDGTGPRVVVRAAAPGRPAPDLDDLRRGRARIGVPGTGTTAFLVLTLLLGTRDFAYEVLPFDRIAEAVRDRRVDAGVLIHDAQLTFDRLGLAQVADLGAWWKRATGLPLPLGANALRRDLADRASARGGGGRAGGGGGGARAGDGDGLRRVAALLSRSVRHALAAHEESLGYAMRWAPGLSRELALRYVAMYVSSLTIDAGETGRRGVEELFRHGAAAGMCPDMGAVEMIAG